MFGTFLLSILSWVVLKVRQNWRFVCVAAAICVFLIAIGLIYRSCTRPVPKAQVDLKTVEAINKQNREERLKALEKTIQENADVVETVDRRSTIAAEDEASRNAAIWAKIAEVNEKVEAARLQGRDVSQEELECMLVPEHCADQ